MKIYTPVPTPGTCKKIYNIKTRLLGRFAPFFFFNCEHFLIANIVKQNQKEYSWIWRKKIKRIFKFNANYWNFDHSETFPAGGHVNPTQNLGTISLAVLTFTGFKQTDKQSVSKNILKCFPSCCKERHSDFGEVVTHQILNT